MIIARNETVNNVLTHIVEEDSEIFYGFSCYADWLHQVYLTLLCQRKDVSG